MSNIVKSAFSPELIEQATRSAQLLAKSDILPVKYQNNPANCLIAYDMALQMNMNPLTVMQNLDIINGKPSWSSKFTRALLEQSPKWSNVELIEVGNRQDRTWGYFVQAVKNETGKTVKGVTVTVEMAQLEGWVNKTGSKWKSMPELMLKYRAIAFFARVEDPSILYGLHTSDEMEDISHRKTEEQDVQIIPNDEVIIPDDEVID